MQRRDVLWRRRFNQFDMSLDGLRGGHGRCPPFVVAGLILGLFVLMFNWWSINTQNNDLVRRLSDVSEQLKMSAEEQDRCSRQRALLDNQLKNSDEESAQLRVKLEQQQTDNQEYKKQLMAKDDEIKSALKSRDDYQSSVKRCSSELESIKKLDISKDGVIESLRLEKVRLMSELTALKHSLEKVEYKLKKAEAELHIKTQEETIRTTKPPAKDPAAPDQTIDHPMQDASDTPPPENVDNLENNGDNPEKGENNTEEKGEAAVGNDDNNAAEKMDLEGNDDIQDE